MDETTVIPAGFPKTYTVRSSVHSLYQKMQGVFFFPSSAFLCCYVRLALTPSCGFFLLYLVDIVLEIYPWSLHLHRDLFKYLERRENYLLVFLVLCRYANLVDHHLPALRPLWVGDNWLVIIRHYYGYYFHFKKTQRQIVQDHRRERHIQDRCIPPAGTKSPELRNGRAFKIWTVSYWGGRTYRVMKTAFTNYQRGRTTEVFLFLFFVFFTVWHCNKNLVVTYTDPSCSEARWSHDF